VLYKRGGRYWIDITVDGVRYRQSLETKNWQEAKQKEKERIQQATAGRLNKRVETFARLAFGEASDKYLEERRGSLAESSYKKEKQLLVPLKRFFEANPIRKISNQHVLDYRQARSNSGVGPVIINMEVAVLGRMFKKARRWQVLAELKPLRQTVSSVGRALEPKQKER